jgi:DNA invertase Pin-like site-specific DNA recombinase
MAVEEHYPIDRLSSDLRTPAKATAAGKYHGRAVDEELHKRVKELLGAGLGIRATARHANYSTTTVLRSRQQADG